MKKLMLAMALSLTLCGSGNDVKKITTVKCYSYGTIIYEGKTKDVYRTKWSWWFRDINGNTVRISSNSNCVEITRKVK